MLPSTYCPLKLFLFTKNIIIAINSFDTWCGRLRKIRNFNFWQFYTSSFGSPNNVIWFYFSVRTWSKIRWISTCYIFRRGLKFRSRWMTFFCFDSMASFSFFILMLSWRMCPFLFIAASLCVQLFFWDPVFLFLLIKRWTC